MKIHWHKTQWGGEYVYLGPAPSRPTFRYMVIENHVEETKEVVVYTFTMGDVEDPDLYAAQPLYEWQESESGKWIMEHAVESPMWHRMADPMSYGYKYSVTAKLQGARLTEWLLRYSK